MVEPSFNLGYLLWTLFNFFLLFGWLIISLLVLLALRKRQISDAAKALWVLISFIPIFGAIAFLLIQPGKSKSAPSE